MQQGSPVPAVLLRTLGMSNVGLAGMGAHRHNGNGALIAAILALAALLWVAVEQQAVARLRAEVVALRQSTGKCTGVQTQHFQIATTDAHYGDPCPHCVCPEDHAVAENKGAQATHKQVCLAPFVQPRRMMHGPLLSLIPCAYGMAASTVHVACKSCFG
jgi:hypothetical protein